MVSGAFDKGMSSLSGAGSVPGHLQVAGRPREFRATLSTFPPALLPQRLGDACPLQSPWCWEEESPWRWHCIVVHSGPPRARYGCTHVCGSICAKDSPLCTLLIGCCCSLRKPGTFEKRRGWVLLYPMVAWCCTRAKSGLVLYNS